MIIFTKIYIANIGVNAYYKSKYGLISPILEDGIFELIPIKENSKIKGPNILKYRDLKCFNSEAPLIKHFPQNNLNTLKNYHVHNDPEFETFTYGDVIDSLRPRSSNLKNIKKGDFLFFIANLSKFQKGKFIKNSSSFYFIGYFEVEKVFIKEKDILSNKKLLSNNAHYKQYIDGNVNIGDFLIIKGSKNSKRFKFPFKITKEFCNLCLRNSKGKKFNWNLNQTELQVIGSYTRTVRAFIDKDKQQRLWKNFWDSIDI